MNDLICAKLKEIIELQDIKKKYLNAEKLVILVNIQCLLSFKRYT